MNIIKIYTGIVKQTVLKHYITILLYIGFIIPNLLINVSISMYQQFTYV